MSEWNLTRNMAVHVWIIWRHFPGKQLLYITVMFTWFLITSIIYSIYTELLYVNSSLLSQLNSRSGSCNLQDHYPNKMMHGRNKVSKCWKWFKIFASVVHSHFPNVFQCFSPSAVTKTFFADGAAKCLNLAEKSAAAPCFCRICHWSAC